MSRYQWIMPAAAVLGLLVVGGCQTTPEQTAMTPGTVSDAELSRLAGDVSAKLAALDETGAARLRPYELELRRLSDALGGSSRQDGMRKPATDGDMTLAPDETKPVSFKPPAAPNLADARSVFHAVRLGIYPSRDAAEAGWVALALSQGEALAGREARIEDAENGFILKAGPFSDAASAMAACEDLQAAGVRCGLSDFTGRDV